MAKGGRGGRRGGGGVTAKGELKLPNGSTIEFDGDLNYDGDDQHITGNVRTNIEAWETRRRGMKVEYAYALDADGNPIGPEVRGGKGSVRTPYSYHEEGATFTHIHPRGDGMLGGTFSEADLRSFSAMDSATTRAAAKEGTYSISKNANFDRAGFNSYVRQVHNDFSANQRSAGRELANNYRSGKITYQQYQTGAAKAFNTALVGLHEAYRAGQNQYGYTYTLEQLK